MEYERTLQNPKRAAELLGQFSVVGVTERHAAFSEALCNATAPQRPRGQRLIEGCTAGTEPEIRQDSMRWRVDDFPTEFVGEMRALLPANVVAIYYVAEGMAVR